jgi:hypothetical protein
MASESRITITPGSYAKDLQRELGLGESCTAPTDARDEAYLWAASGARYLTGEANGPALPAPAPLATCIQGAWLALAELSKGALAQDFPAYQLLGERAAIAGLQRQGAISVGGACRLLRCADGELALSLTRPDDWSLVPAWLELDADCWETIAKELQHRSCAAMVSRARLLGLAAAASKPPVPQRDWFKADRLAPAAKRQGEPPLVLDLTSLWAGPLCAQLLGRLGARVIKLESTARPDGARHGSPTFFDLLNAGKESVVLDLACEPGRHQLKELLSRADIVIESSRPRALEQLGIQAADMVRVGAGRVWLSITGYGREAPMREWIAYGDDAGVAAGLSWLLREATGSSVFCADAIADPLTGVHAALLAWTAWAQGGGVLVDLSLRGVVAHCIAAGGAYSSGKPMSTAADIIAPQARTASAPAVPLGHNTAQVLREFSITT